MNLTTIKNSATTALHTGKFFAQKYAPEILTGVGIVGGIGSTILAARATLKLEAILDDMAIRMEGLKDDESRAKLYVITGLKITKLYGPSVSLGVASIAAILAGHGMLRKRNAALVAAYGVLERAFDTYRGRVIDEFGEEKDYEFRHGLKQVTTGKGDKKEVAMVFDPDLVVSPYARVFRRWSHPDGGSTQWDPTPEYNIVFLSAQETFANQKLQAKGHVFLNEVYEALGFEHSAEGAMAGWVKGEGDDFIDFGFRDPRNIRTGSLIDGEEGNIFLDFNVQGEIVSKIGKKRK